MEAVAALDSLAHELDKALADFPNAKAITLRHLLTHTSGFDGDVWPDHGDDEQSRSRLAAACAELPQLL